MERCRDAICNISLNIRGKSDCRLWDNIVKIVEVEEEQEKKCGVGR
ncbi:MAG: hypothetical protein H6Q75_278 [Firmicutes bacterium]|nr:hypothetical protein [Bacillota bacterium]